MYRMSSMAGYSPYRMESTEDASKIKSAAFPENGRTGINAGSSGTTNTMGVVHDPFVGSSKPKGEGKLSATASSFQPFGIDFNFTSASATKVMNHKGVKVPKSALPMPGTAAHVESIIAAEEKSPRRGAPAPSSAPRSAPLVTKGGFFSTESVHSRHVKVIGIFIDDVGVRVQKSIEKFGKCGYEVKSTLRVEQDKNVVYLAFADIRDALAFSAAVAKDHDSICVEFIQGNELNEIKSPLATGIASAYEGQVLVHVRYPLGCDQGQFEEEVRGLLDANGRSVLAWQKLLDREPGSFALVVEYHDVGDAKIAMQELHGKVIGVAPRATILSVCEHRPTVPKQVAQPKVAPFATPIRQVNDPNFLDLMDNMGINKGKAPEPVIMSFATPVNPAGLSYLPSANPSYSGPFGIAAHGAMYSSDSQTTIGAGMGMGNMYTGMNPQPPFPMGGSMIGNMSTGTTPNMSYGMGSSMTGYSPYAPTSYAGHGPTPVRFNQPEFGRPTPMGNPSFGAGSMSYGSPSAGHSPEFGYSPSPARPVRRENAVKVPYHIAATYRRNQPSTGANHNVVEIENIQFGIDVRTTVMLRNIPNKVTQAELKKYVDQSSFGMYDFMYLRIDFSNDCNVGYAFINFVDPLDIVPFVNLRAGQKWDAFRSEKRAEVSYATIQGRDCLIQKFRNSSVMLEPPTARPKLFFVFPDPMVGQEEPFPEADNHSKLTRSCQNAENVGLFAPSAGQHLRDEQRRRRSQFDRGTSLAEREEYNFEHHSWGPYRTYR